MYDDNTTSANGSGSRDRNFQHILENVAGTIRRRLLNYDEARDPLKRSHLKLLWDIVMIEAERVAAGESKLYTGLESPIKAVQDWGEPSNSILTSSMKNAEQYYHQNYKRTRLGNNGRHLAACILVALSMAFWSLNIWAQDPAAGDQSKASNAVMWEPVEIRNRNLFIGPGAGKVAPDLKGAVVMGRQFGGNNTKYRIRANDGHEWVAKVADESQPETAAVRLLWGIGYKTEVNFLIPELTLGKYGTFNNVRLEARPKDMKRGERWMWSDNPFVGTKELDGLKLMMAMVNNWDLKDENNVILITEDGRHQYVVSDLGASFGKLAKEPNSRSGRSVNDPDGYAESVFIKGARGGILDLAYTGMAQDLMSGIRVEHGRWLADLLLQLSDRQIQDAFRAAHYSDEKSATLAAAFKARIAALDNATRSVVATQ